MDSNLLHRVVSQKPEQLSEEMLRLSRKPAYIIALV